MNKTINYLESINYVPNTNLVLRKKYVLQRHGYNIPLEIVFDFRNKKTVEIWVWQDGEQKYTKEYNIWLAEELKPLKDILRKEKIKVEYMPNE